jgi:hypothetical protein
MPLLKWAMFSPGPVPPRFQAEYSSAMALRPSQIRATSVDGALMIPGALNLRAHYKNGESSEQTTDIGARTCIHLCRDMQRSPRRIPPGTRRGCRVSSLVRRAVEADPDLRRALEAWSAI